MMREGPQQDKQRRQYAVMTNAQEFAFEAGAFQKYNSRKWR